MDTFRYPFRCRVAAPTAASELNSSRKKQMTKQLLISSINNHNSTEIIIKQKTSRHQLLRITTQSFDEIFIVLNGKINKTWNSSRSTQFLICWSIMTTQTHNVLDIIWANFNFIIQIHQIDCFSWLIYIDKAYFLLEFLGGEREEGMCSYDGGDYHKVLRFFKEKLNSFWSGLQMTTRFLGFFLPSPF